MKIQKKALSGKPGQQSGFYTLLPQTSEDIWHLFNLLTTSDQVAATAVRKVVHEGVTGSVRSDKVKLTLKLQLTAPPHFSGDDPPTLRLSGTNLTENSHGIKLGAYHTLTIGVQSQITIYKDLWDKVCLDRITDSADEGTGADLAALVLHPGVGHLCLVTKFLTLTKSKVEVAIPKKRSAGKGASSAGGPQQNYDKAMQRFFAQLYRGVLEHVNFESVKCLLIGGPGFIAEDFKAFALEKASKDGDRALLESRDKFVTCRASSGYKHAISEMLAEEEVLHRVKDTKVSRDVVVLNDFMRLLNTAPERAYYGYKHVSFLSESYSGAIERLLITDELFRHSDPVKRRRYIKLTEDVEKCGGAVVIFSTMHVSGRQLQMVCGVAAALRFPVTDERMDEGEDEENDVDENPATFD